MKVFLLLRKKWKKMKNKKSNLKLTAVLFFFIVSSTCFGQFNEIIRTGRPGQSIGAFTVGKNVLQFQQGINYYSIEDTNPIKGFVSNNIIRYGISETIEVSTLIDYQNEEISFENNTYKHREGISNLHFGFRAHINEQKGWFPVTGFQMRLKIPNVSCEFETKYVAADMIFVANWVLPKNMSLATNWVMSYSGNDPNPLGKYVINFGFQIHKKLSGFVGNYGQINQSVFQTRFEGGFAYLINNDFAIDLSSGFGKNQGLTDYFVSTGISYRFLKFRNSVK
ncbi:transporter [Flavobacterium sp. N2469]|uniref:transporter n=2 Tax=Flavobacterium TaxID=237 RepID=UPI002221D489|nr:transporter [Flavobacterium sp. N2469]